MAAGSFFNARFVVRLGLDRVLRFGALLPRGRRRADGDHRRRSPTARRRCSLFALVDGRAAPGRRRDHAERQHRGDAAAAARRGHGRGDPRHGLDGRRGAARLGRSTPGSTARSRPFAQGVLVYALVAAGGIFLLGLRRAPARGARPKRSASGRSPPTTDNGSVAPASIASRVNRSPRLAAPRADVAELGRQQPPDPPAQSAPGTNPATSCSGSTEPLPARHGKLHSRVIHRPAGTRRPQHGKTSPRAWPHHAIISRTSFVGYARPSVEAGQLSCGWLN